MALNDFLPFDANEYRAVVNPTSLVIQAWGYGRRLVLLPGEVTVPNRACVQFVRTRIANKAVKNQRRFLEIWTVEQGMRLLNLARQLKDFQLAYTKLTGRRTQKVTEILAEQQQRTSLRRALIHGVGVPEDMMETWTVDDMRAVLKDQTLVADIDPVTKRPRRDTGPSGKSVFDVMQDVAREDTPSVREFFHDSRPRLPSAEDRVGDAGRPGDFFVPATIGDDAKLPEEVAAAATLEYDVKTGGAVKGRAPERVPTTTGGFEAVDEIDPIDLEPPVAEPEPPAAPANSRERIVELRNQIDAAGGSWHPRSGVAKLEQQLAELVNG